MGDGVQIKHEAAVGIPPNRGGMIYRERIVCGPPEVSTEVGEKARE